MNWFGWVLVAFFVLGIIGIINRSAPTRIDTLALLIFVLLLVGTVIVRT